jgi:type I restriction enzyme S subunit
MNSSIVKLGEIANVFNGKTPAESEQRRSGFPVLKIRDVDENGVFVGSFNSFIDKELADQFPEKLICANDVMILNAAHNADYVASKLFFATNEVAGALSTGEWLIVRANEKKVDPRYIYYWLQDAKTKYLIRLLVKGIHLYPKDVAELNIPLPPLTEQKRIASLLRRADRLRQLRRTAHDLGESLLQSVFLEMFGDVVRNDKGWEKVSISDLGKVQTGNTPSREEPENYGDFIEWIKSDNIRDEQLYVSPSREKLSEIGLKKGRSVDAGAVLVTCIAGSLEHIGDTSLADRTVAFNQQINAISPFDDVNPLFLRSMMHIAKPYIQFNASAGMKHIITKSKLEELVLVKPPLSLQEEFAGVVRRVEGLRGRMVESTRQVEGLFESFLAQSFSGGG